MELLKIFLVMKESLMSLNFLKMLKVTNNDTFFDSIIYLVHYLNIFGV